MRILLVSECACSHNGGMNRMVVETCDGLAAAGHQILLAYQLDLPITVSIPTCHIGYPANRDRLLTAADEFRPEVIYVHKLHPASLLRDLSRLAPTVVFLHDQSWICSMGDRMTRGWQPCHRAHGVACLLHHYFSGCGGKSPLGNWRRWSVTQELQVLKELSYVRLHVASRFMKQGLQENGFPSDRIDILPLFSAVPPTPLQPVDPSGYLLLPSRLVRGKGVDFAIRSLATIHDLPWKLVIAGGGQQTAELTRLVTELGVSNQVTFLGEIPPVELARWYHHCLGVLFPVLRAEPFGLTGIEAMAHGKPVVALSGGAVAEWMVPGKTGWLVHERTLAGFAKAVRELLETSPGHLSELAECTRRHHRENFTRSAFLARLEASFLQPGSLPSAGPSHPHPV